MATLIPDYLNVDFSSFIERLKTQIQNSDVFTDVDYEGSNIALLIELMGYHSELTTFFANKIAKNNYMGPAEIFENVHRLSKLRGYSPKGYISHETTLTVSLSLTAGEVEAGDTIQIPNWFTLETGETTEDEDDINYCITEGTTISIPTTASDDYSFTLTARQGDYKTISKTGEDLIDNQIILTDFDYDYGNYPYTNRTSLVYVNGTAWERIEDEFDDLSGLSTDDNVYKFGFDKYKHYFIEFFNSRNIPSDDDRIEIILLETLGEDGGISSGKITTFTNQTIPELNTTTNEIDETSDQSFIRNITDSVNLTTASITLTNSVSSGGDDYETISTIKDNSESYLYSQKRTAIKDDFKEKIEEKTNISKANVWGEKEENPDTYDTTNFFKYYISVIPSSWGGSTISTSTSAEWSVGDLTQEITEPIEFDSDFESDILEFIEPYKMENTYEIFTVPVLVNFRFDIGLKVKRTFNYSTVSNTVKEKLEYYFSTSKRNFGDTIDFKELHNFLLDLSETSSDDDFSGIRGVTNLIIRDVETYTPDISGGDPNFIFDYNTSGNYPMYADIDLDADYDNLLKPITLGYKQFPILACDVCIFSNEG